LLTTGTESSQAISNGSFSRISLAATVELV
jgi:hypothetical protein